MLHLFNAMAQLLKLPTMAFFQHYTKDFFEHDRRELITWGAPGARYIWVVRDSGTHLIRIGVDPKSCEYGMAVLEQISRNRNCPSALFVRIFEITDRTITEIDVGHAQRLLGASSDAYKVRNGVVSRRDGGNSYRDLATLRIDTQTRSAAMPLRHVRFTTSNKLSPADVGALRIIAQCEVVRASQSLFTSPASIEIDGVDVCDVMVNALSGSAAAIDDLAQSPVKVTWLNSANSGSGAVRPLVAA